VDEKLTAIKNKIITSLQNGEKLIVLNNNDKFTVVDIGGYHSIQVESHVDKFKFNGYGIETLDPAHVFLFNDIELIPAF
jgi:hypothetical protein